MTLFILKDERSQGVGGAGYAGNRRIVSIQFSSPSRGEGSAPGPQATREPIKPSPFLHGLDPKRTQRAHRDGSVELI